MVSILPPFEKCQPIVYHRSMAIATVTATKIDWKSMGEYIADRRRAIGMTQGELAEAVSRKQPDISAIEAGRVQSTLETLVNVAAALKIDIKTLVGKFLKK